MDMDDHTALSNGRVSRDAPKGSLTPFKFTIQAHLLGKDEDGKIIDEAATEPVVVFGETLEEVAEKYMEILRTAIEQAKGA